MPNQPPTEAIADNVADPSISSTPLGQMAPQLVQVNAAGCDKPRLRSGSCFLPRQLEAVLMAKSNTKRKRTPEHILKLPELEQSKSAVLNSLRSRSSQRTYDHAIREFIDHSRAIGTYPWTRRLQMECRKHAPSWTTRTFDVLARSDTL
jgi:hypothetical protein